MLIASGCRGRLISRHEETVIDEQCRRCRQAYRHDHKPYHLRLMQLLTIMLKQPATQRTAYQRANADRQERKSHVSALLPGRRQARDVVVIRWLLGDLTQRHHKDGCDRAYHRGMKRKDEPSE